MRVHKKAAYTGGVSEPLGPSEEKDKDGGEVALRRCNVPRRERFSSSPR